MNEKRIEGKYDQAKGEVKQDVGQMVDDEDLEAEGTWDKVKGSVKEGVGKVEDAVNER